MMFGDEWTTRAYEHFTSCLRTGQDGVSQAYGKDVFDLLAERPDQLRDLPSGDDERLHTGRKRHHPSLRF